MDPTQSQKPQDLNLAAAILENIPVSILITDVNGVIVWANHAFSEATGYSLEEVRGQTPQMFQSSQDDGFYESLWGELAEKGRWQGETWNRRKDGSACLEWLTVGPLLDTSGAVAFFIATYVDISALKQTDEKARYLAYHDSLTGLPNRLLFSDRLSHALARSRRHGFKVALLYVDLDGFKAVNDTYGHDGGDELLQGVADRLKEILREEDTLARLGGDEFGIVAGDVAGEEGACRVAERVLDGIQLPFIIQEAKVKIGASIGVVMCDPGRFSANELMTMADQAMYQAKAVGKNRFAIVRAFRPDRNEE